MRIFLFIGVLFLFSSIALANNDTRRDRVYGTGSGAAGSVTTYVDPQTGDIVTSVRPAEKNPYYNQNNYQHNQQNVPIFVYPQVAPEWPPNPGPHTKP